MARVEGIPRETLRKALLYPPAVPAHPFVGQKYSLGEAKEEVLRQLLNWIEDFNSAGIPLPFTSIVCSYENLVGLWNRNHTNRITLYSEQGLRKKLDDLGVSRRRMYGERLDADHGEAHDFVGRFGSLVSEYDPDLVFNFDETAFYWKQSIDVTYCVNTIDPSGW